MIVNIASYDQDIYKKYFGINKFSNTAKHKVNKQTRAAFLCAENEHGKTKIKDTTPLMTAPK